MTVVLDRRLVSVSAGGRGINGMRRVVSVGGFFAVSAGGPCPETYLGAASTSSAPARIHEDARKGGKRTKPLRWGRNPPTARAARGQSSLGRWTTPFTSGAALNSSSRRVEYTGQARPYNPVERLKFRSVGPVR